MKGHLGILDLLAPFGFDPTRSRLVRHQDRRYDVHDLLRRGWFEAYQSFQGRPIFDGVDRIVSFVGTAGTTARLVGVYRVAAKRSGAEGVLPAGCRHTEWLKSTHFYELHRESGFEAIEHRAVIDWGKATRVWVQRTDNRPVVELLPPGNVVRLFKDYLDFTLTHAELKGIILNAEANSEWRARLSAVAGIYLILAATTGHQYVGSACGADGIWGRWSAYAETGHGGNVQLRDLIASDPSYPDSSWISHAPASGQCAARQAMESCS